MTKVAMFDFHAASRWLRLALLLLPLGLLALLGGCFEQSSAFERSLGEKFRASQPYAYRADSPYADVMGDCMAITSASQSCRFNELPPLGWPDNQVPEIDDIMDRVLVSHDWMGERFEALLHDMPEDMLYLFRSLTAVTFSADIRPSYYSIWRGAMFIDPNYLWLTAEERNQIDLSPDFRSDFGRDLQFEKLWRYVLDNDYAFRIASISATNVEPRDLDDLRLALARLLYHELAHAVDFMSPARTETVQGHQRMAFVAFPDVSNELTGSSPLGSMIMEALAQVRYMGESASADQQAMTADEVAGHFSPDPAVHWYSYSTVHEDQAMLFEALMSYHHFNMEMDVAFVAKDELGDTDADTPIRWGQRNRIGDPAIQERGRLILELMLPELDPDDYLEGISPPKDLVAGATWHENLDPDTLSPKADPQPLSIQGELHEGRNDGAGDPPPSQGDGR